MYAARNSGSLCRCSNFKFQTSSGFGSGSTFFVEKSLRIAESMNEP